MNGKRLHWILSDILEMTSGKLEVSHGNEEKVKDGLLGAG